MTTTPDPAGLVQGSAGDLALAALDPYGVRELYTLNGAHVWPLYEAAVARSWRLVDVRHEQSAVFAAEATAKLTRRPGLAVLTAGPGVTNGMSGITTAHFNGSPLVVLAGRAPQARWGAGSLQEIDHLPLVAPVTKASATVTAPSDAAGVVACLAEAAVTPHRGPVFADIPLDVVFSPGEATVGPLPERVGRGTEPDPEAVAALAARIAAAERPAFVVGSDVYWAGAEHALVRAAEHLQVPCWANGLGRGVVPAGHPLAASRTRGLLRSQADLVVVIGAPLDFRLGFGHFGTADVAHVADTAEGLAGHATLVAAVAGDLVAVLDGLAAWEGPRRADHGPWIEQVRAGERAGAEADAALLAADADPIKPTRIYGELARRLTDDTVVVCDGGDFVSYAGKYVEVRRPGTWLDTGPYGCLGNGLGYAVAARVVCPDAPVVALLGDGAAGFSLLEADTLVRHGLGVVLVVGNNGIWGLEKHPMRAIYGHDLACDLQPETRYDEVVRALGGAGETVRRPGDIGPALDRALDAARGGTPYLVNVITDPDDAYPRSSNLA